MSFPYKNPITGQQTDGPMSISRNAVQGTNFSVLGVGGYMEVYNLNDLSLVFSGTGIQEFSGNTIPIQLTIGSNNTFNSTLLTLNSDNISSGRRKLGMLVYVISEDQIYQYTIPNYETLWNSISGQTTVINISDYTTTVNSRTQEGRDFIAAWTGSTIEGVSGGTRDNSRWIKYYDNTLVVTGGTYNSGTTTLTLVNITGGTVEIPGFTSQNNTSIYNKPNTILPASGFTQNDGLWEWTILDTDITVNSVVDFTPYNTYIPIVVDAGFLPYISANTSSATFYSTFQPSGDTVGQLVIFR